VPQSPITSPMDANAPAYDGTDGTAGGAAFGAAIARLAAEKELDTAALAEQAGLDPALVERIVAGEARVAVPVLARLARALRVRPIGFLQQTELLGLSVYALGLDPLYFLPDGQIRYDARIYMREINPRHAVPEGDMTKRNPVFKALTDDTVLDPLGKIEVELAYLLRAAIQGTGGTL
jgi:transcriptional regulator with XRE-family HTH domain